MKNAKKRSKLHEKIAVFCHFLDMNGKLWAQKKFLLIFSARDDLGKVSWKSDVGKCQNQITPPYFDQLSERHQLLCIT